MHFDLPSLISSFGYLGVWAIIFAESGLLVGFFLPGDSLLVTAGFVASHPNTLNIWILMIGCFVAAVVGDNVGYMTGNRFGRRLFQKEDSWLFHKKNLTRAQKFYDQNGRKTIILARFLPIVRTFAPIVAGIGTMRYSIFFAYNLIGGAVWTFGLCMLGYGLGHFLGKTIDVDRYLLPIILVIVALSVLPSIFHLYRESRR